MSTVAEPHVAVILPPREGFGPNRTGALGLLARRLTNTPGFRTTIFGGMQDGPVFPGIDFIPIKPTLWWPGPTNVRFAIAVARSLQKVRPALVEVHNRPEIALAIAERLPDTPVTLILNNDPTEMRGAQSPSERAALLGKLALVMTSSDYLRNRLLQDVTDPPRQPVLLPNCLDLTELPPPRSRERLILFAGRVVAEKGPDAFVMACATALPHLPGWRAIVIGADRFRPNAPETTFVKSVQAVAAVASVSMAGYRDHPEVLEAMSRAAIVVVPSRWPEPFGLVALEAMASGAALICSPRGGLREVAGDAALYADPDQPAEIANALRTLGRDEHVRLAMADAGRARARQFDLPVIAERLAMLRLRVIK